MTASPPNRDAKMLWQEVASYLESEQLFEPRIAWLAADVVAFSKPLSAVWPGDLTEVKHAVSFVRRSGLLGGDAA